MGTHVQLMGGFGVFHEGKLIDLPDSTRQLIACLALNDGPQERSLVAAILWPEKPEQRAAANLRSSAWWTVGGSTTAAGSRRAI